MDGDGHGCPIPTAGPLPVVVIGAGASGLLSARALLRSGHRAVVLVERDRTWSAGPAYSTRDPQHLLNVPAGKLSVDSDRPADFVDWAARRQWGVTGSTFVARSLFGEYLREALESAATDAPFATLTRVTADVVGVETGFAGDRARVVLADGRGIDAADVVLALGNPPARPLPGDADAVIGDPWSVCGGRMAADDSVVLVGSGLTAVDVALTLTARGHRGLIRMVSRHALLPSAHRTRPAAPVDTLDRFFVPTARSAVAWMRAAIADADGDWRAVFDAIRHDTNEIWARFPEHERARLLRHVARRWEVHRHRMAPAVAARLDDLLAAGGVTVHAGTVTAVERSAGDPARARVNVGVRGADGRQSTTTADHVVNCTGPNFDLRQSESRLVRALFASGGARPGPLGLGFDVTAAGALVDALGRPSQSVSVVGPLRRGAEWETTAIPDIRRQAEAVAPRIVARTAFRPAQFAAVEVD